MIVVEAKYDGNLGAVARAMANFGLSDLVLVNPPALGNAARERAVHAWSILEKARVCTSLDEALQGIDYAVGTASDVARNEKRDLRRPMPLRDLAKRVWDLSGNVGILLGREDFGLVNDEVERCDVVVTIPTHPEYRSMNLSHAAAVIFYELMASRYAPRAPRRANAKERDVLYAHWNALLNAIELPEHRVKIMNVTMKRILGRAMLSGWEYNRLMGVVRGSVDRIEGRKKRKRQGGSRERE